MRLIIMGDSLSAGVDSWPTFLNIDNCVIHLMAQNGRRASAFDVPRDLYPSGSLSDNKVVYMLGANDIGTQSVHNGNPAPTKFWVETHLRALIDREFNPIVMIPPKFRLSGLSRSNIRHRAMFRVLASGEFFNTEFVDLNLVWDKSLTHDGVHPKPELSEKIAGLIKPFILKSS